VARLPVLTDSIAGVFSQPAPTSIGSNEFSTTNDSSQGIPLPLNGPIHTPLFAQDGAVCTDSTLANAAIELAANIASIDTSRHTKVTTRQNQPIRMHCDKQAGHQRNNCDQQEHISRRLYSPSHSLHSGARLCTPPPEQEYLSR